MDNNISEAVHGLESDVAAQEATLTKLKAELEQLKEWRDAVSRGIKNIPEFGTGEWGGNKEGWGYHFEVVNWLQRERTRLAEIVKQCHEANGPVEVEVDADLPSAIRKWREKASQEYSKAKREIERKYLTNELVAVEQLRAKEGQITALKQVVAERDNEIERLKAEIKTLVADGNARAGECLQYEKDIPKLRRQIAALESALKSPGIIEKLRKGGVAVPVLNRTTGDYDRVDLPQMPAEDEFGRPIMSITEKQRRVYYQDIVYSVCSQLDEALGRHISKSNGIVCGTADSPSMEVEDTLKEVLAERHIAMNDAAHWKTEFVKLIKNQKSRRVEEGGREQTEDDSQHDARRQSAPVATGTHYRNRGDHSVKFEARPAPDKSDYMVYSKDDRKAWMEVELFDLLFEPDEPSPYANLPLWEQWAKTDSGPWIGDLKGCAKRFEEWLHKHGHLKD